MHLVFDTVVGAVKAALPIAKMLAAITTATQWDDKAVLLLETVVNNQALLDFIHKLLGEDEVVNSSGAARSLAIAAACEKHGTDVVKSAAAAAGFDWQTLIQYVSQIVTLVLTVLGLRR